MRKELLVSGYSVSMDHLEATMEGVAVQGANFSVAGIKMRSVLLRLTKTHIRVIDSCLCNITTMTLTLT